jgi:hypothetical protein
MLNFLDKITIHMWVMIWNLYLGYALLESENTPVMDFIQKWTGGALTEGGYAMLLSFSIIALFAFPAMRLKGFVVTNFPLIAYGIISVIYTFVEWQESSTYVGAVMRLFAVVVTVLLIKENYYFREVVTPRMVAQRKQIAALEVAVEELAEEKRTESVEENGRTGANEAAPS